MSKCFIKQLGILNQEIPFTNENETLILKLLRVLQEIILKLFKSFKKKSTNNIVEEFVCSIGNIMENSLFHNEFNLILHGLVESLSKSMADEMSKESEQIDIPFVKNHLKNIKVKTFFRI